MKKSARKKGFTLIELLVVIAIVGVLAAVVLIAINPAKRLAQARDSGRKSDVGQIATGAQAYYTTGGRYPTTLAELTTSGDLKTAPTAPSTAVCPTNYVMTSFGSGTSITELIVSVCLESPLSSSFTAPGAWAWCSSTGVTKEYQTAPGALTSC